MPKHDEEMNSGLVTIEAGTVEEAMERLADELGADAEIIDAQKVHRGGIGGFFARERVELTARNRVTSDPRASMTFDDLLAAHVDDAHATVDMGRISEFVGGDTAGPRPAFQPDLTSPDGAMPDESDPAPVAVGPLAGLASRDAADEPPLMAPPPVHDVPARVPVQPSISTSDEWRIQRPSTATPPGAGTVDWGVRQLIRHDAPGRLIAAVADLDQHDDLGWIHGLASSVAKLCRPLPPDDTIVVGVHADRLGAMLGIPVVEPGDIAPYTGSFASPLMGDPGDRRWLELVRGDRALHVIAGVSDRWRELLVCDPTVVSWVGESSVLDAVALASAVGAPLGYGTPDGVLSPMVRALPVDVALAIRRLVGRA